MKRSAWLEDILTWARTLPRVDMSEYEQAPAQPDGVRFHHVPPTEPLPAAPAPSPAPAAPTTGTSPEMVRHMVAQKRAEMRAAEIARTYRGTPGQRRLANEAARAFKHAVATTPPNPYDAPAAERRRLDELKEARR